MAMLRTLHTIGILALSVAGLVIILCAADGLREDSRGAPVAAVSAIEEFATRHRNDQDSGSEQLSPLVRQAQAFALYLNPPSVPSALDGPARLHAEQALQPMAEQDGNAAPAVKVRPTSSSAKFELHGISYYRSDPDRSMALVFEPGSGRRWVRPGAQLGHLVIERIDCDSLVYRDGMQTHAMALASGEALEKFAKGSGDVSTPKETHRPVRTASAPPPVRGIRQMPLARVAAKIGVPLSELQLPNSGAVKSQ